MAALSSGIIYLEAGWNPVDLGKYVLFKMSFMWSSSAFIWSTEQSFNCWFKCVHGNGRDKCGMFINVFLYLSRWLSGSENITIWSCKCFRKLRMKNDLRAIWLKCFACSRSNSLLFEFSVCIYERRHSIIMRRRGIWNKYFYFLLPM